MNMRKDMVRTSTQICHPAARPASPCERLARMAISSCTAGSSIKQKEKPLVQYKRRYHSFPVAADFPCIRAWHGYSVEPGTRGSFQVRNSRQHTMSFVAKCPFCPGTQRLKDSALAASVLCPSCKSYYTAVPHHSRGPAKTTISRAEQFSRIHPQQVVAKSPPAAEMSTVAQVAASESSAPEEIDSPETRSETIPLLPSASLLCGSTALVSASLSGLQFATLPLAITGLVLAGIGSCCERRGKALVRLAPAFGGALSLSVLVVALFWPGILGVTFAHWREQASVLDNRLKFIPAQGTAANAVGASSEEEGVDVSLGAARKGDVQIGVNSSGTGLYKFRSSKGKRESQEHYLQITIRISNVGGTRALHFAGCGQVSSPDESTLPQLRDHLGRTCPFLNSRRKEELPRQLERAVIVPGKFVELPLFFEQPRGKIEYLRLDIPAEAWGDHGKIHLRIPATLLVRR